MTKQQSKDTSKCTQGTASKDTLTIVTAGSTYLDIDAYACCVAMADLLRWKGQKAVAYSIAPRNYSICRSLVSEGQVVDHLPSTFCPEHAEYIVVDVSDPEYIRDSIPLHQVRKVYDHHVGFEEYWLHQIGDGAHIEFIGAAATLIYREWKTAGLQGRMSRSTARLMIAAILDNTLNLASANTTEEDIEAFNELCRIAGVNNEWCASYFSEVQSHVEGDLYNALFGDIKTIREHAVLPPRLAQLCIWDAKRILGRLPEIRGWFGRSTDAWMINIIDLKQFCSYFVCDSVTYQKQIENAFHVHFEAGVAELSKACLRKEILRITQRIMQGDNT